MIVTDREELDDQISKTFKATGATAREDVRATSGEHLQELLRGNERYIVGPAKFKPPRRAAVT